jgi:integrase
MACIRIKEGRRTIRPHSRNPFDRGKSLLLKENNKRPRFLSEDEIERLLSKCPKHTRRIVICALNSGMRRGEILNLKWSQVRNGFIYLQKTKTNESREILINEDLDRLFKEIRKEDQLQSDYVFTYRPGEDQIKEGKGSRKKRSRSRLGETSKASSEVLARSAQRPESKISDSTTPVTRSQVIS